MKGRRRTNSCKRVIEGESIVIQNGDGSMVVTVVQSSSAVGRHVPQEGVGFILHVVVDMVKVVAN